MNTAVKLSELPDAQLPMVGNELIEITQGGLSKKVSAQNLPYPAPPAPPDITGKLDKDITVLDAAAALADADILPVQQGTGVVKRTTIGALWTRLLARANTWALAQAFTLAIKVPAVNIDAASGRGLFGRTAAGSTRWRVMPGDDAAEAGSNAGSNFLISRYTDAGVLIDSPISIERSTGAITYITPGATTFRVGIAGVRQIMELQVTSPGPVDGQLGQLTWTDLSHSAADKRLAAFVAYRTSTSDNTAGGSISLYTKPNGGGEWLPRLIIDQNGKVTIPGFLAVGTGPVTKTVLLTGTTGATDGSSVSVAHGLTLAKIIDCRILITLSATNKIPHAYVGAAGQAVDYVINATNLVLTNRGLASGGVLSKAFTAYITYIE